MVFRAALDREGDTGHRYRLAIQGAELVPPFGHEISRGLEIECERRAAELLQGWEPVRRGPYTETTRCYAPSGGEASSLRSALQRSVPWRCGGGD